MGIHIMYKLFDKQLVAACQTVEATDIPEAIEKVKQAQPEELRDNFKVLVAMDLEALKDDILPLNAHTDPDTLHNKMHEILS